MNMTTEHKLTSVVSDEQTMAERRAHFREIINKLRSKKAEEQHFVTQKRMPKVFADAIAAREANKEVNKEKLLDLIKKASAE